MIHLFRSRPLGVYPDSSGTIIINPNVSSYKIGDKFTFTAQPYSDREFFKWGGTILSYQKSFEFIVNTQNQLFIAYFPLLVSGDSTIMIGSYPAHTISKGVYAFFDLALSLPLDSTYTVYCVCEKYDYFSFGIKCAGDGMGIRAGCMNNSPIIQTQWLVKVVSDKTGKIVSQFPFTYQVEWN